MKALFQSIKYSCRQLVSRRIYLVTMLVVPVVAVLFFCDLMGAGLPLKVPSAVVDLDHSSLSRRMTRNLAADELLDLSAQPESYLHARDLVRTGKIYGFFLIPEDFEKDAVSGRNPTITYYANMTYFIPGTLAFKGFKTQAVTTSGGLAVATLSATGFPGDEASTLINPVNIDIRAPGNPWLNYNVYLTNSFIPALLALLIGIVTAYSILVEIKHGTSRRWLEASGGSMLTAVVGRLIPQFILWFITGMAVMGVMYGFFHFPMNCPVWHMVLAMTLMIIASQWYAVIWCCIVPNLRLAVSMCSLTGVLAFSIAAFSFPLDQMYGGIAIFSYILPIRYYFLIYADQALNGIPLYYSRFFYAALLVFPLIGMAGLGRLRGRCVKQVYVP